MNEERKVFDVQCGDGTEGKVSARSESEAQEMAGEMCQVHDGVAQEPRSKKPGT